MTRLWRIVLGVTVATTLAVPAGMSLGLASSDASTPSPCSASALAPTVGRGSAAAGTGYETLLITSHVKGTDASTGWCTLSGTPTTQFGNFVVSGTHHHVIEFVGAGPAAMKLAWADRGKTITLKPGAVASVTVGIETAADIMPQSRCDPVYISRVRLAFKSGATLYFTLRRVAVCTKVATTLTSGVVLGTRYP